MRFHIFLYSLLFIFILPLELLTWAAALDHILEGTFLSRRVLMNPLFELSPIWIRILAGGGILAMLNGFRMIIRGRQDACDIQLYSGFVIFCTSLFLWFKQPYGIGFILPVVILGMFAIYSSFRNSGNPSILFAHTSAGTTWKDRISTCFLLFPLITAALLLFQEGFLHWLAFPHSRYFLLLPFAGCLIPDRKKLKNFITSSYGALILLLIVFSITNLLVDGSMLTDISIISAFIFLELEAAFLLHGLLPFRRNFSILILLLTIPATLYLMPPICDYKFVTLSVFLIYVFAENMGLIRKKILSRSESASGNIRFISKEEYAGQAWGFAAVLVAFLAGPLSFFPVMITIAAVMVTALFRRRLGISGVWPEMLAMCAAAIAVGAPGCRTTLLLAAFACAAPLMKSIWQTGAMINQYGEERPLQKSYLALTNAGLFFILLMMYLYHAHDMLLIGLYFILTGIIQLGEYAYERKHHHMKLLGGWLQIILGQIITIIPGTALPTPEWSINAFYGGLFAFFALYFFHTFDQNHNIAKKGSES